MNLKTIVLVAAAALAASAVGVGYAAIPASNGAISACKDPKGALKVIDAEAGQTCNANQQLLTWNQQGPAGPQGAPGISGYEIVRASTSSSDADLKTLTAACPDGKFVIGGGARALGITSSGEPNAAVTQSGPVGVLSTSQSWKGRAVEVTPISSPDSWSLFVYAICANVG